MRSGGNNYNYFPDNKLTTLVNFVQLIRTCMLMFCLEDWGAGHPAPPLWLCHWMLMQLWLTRSLAKSHAFRVSLTHFYFSFFLYNRPTQIGTAVVVNTKNAYSLLTLLRSD